MSSPVVNNRTLWWWQEPAGMWQGLNVTEACVVGGLACSLCCCSSLIRALAVGCMVSLTCAIVLGNLVTLIVLVQTRQCHTPQGYLKVSLAMADMMVGMLVVPFSIYTEILLLVSNSAPRWYQGEAPPRPGWQPCRLMGPIFAGCTFVSISTIFLLALERSVAVLWPLHRDVLVTRCRTLTLVFFSWAGSFLLALAPLAAGGSFTLEYNRCSRMCNYAPLWDGMTPPPDPSVMLIFPVFDFTLLGGTLAVNALSFIHIRRYSRKRRMLSGGGASTCPAHTRPSRSDIKAAITIGILTLAFTAFFSPIAIFVSGSVVGKDWCGFSLFAFWMLTANSCCNVVIYSVRDRRFRYGVTVLLHRSQLLSPKEKGSEPAC